MIDIWRAFLRSADGVHCLLSILALWFLMLTVAWGLGACLWETC